MAPLTIGFLMDPLETVRVDHDSTFALMHAAQAQGHRVRYFQQSWLHFAGSEARARMRTVKVSKTEGAHFEVLQEGVEPISGLDVLFMRKDPPVDAEFLHATQLVELCGPKRPVFINDPQGIRDANEKLFALHFHDLMPQTLVTGESALLREFIQAHPEGTILKPVDGYAGKGIVFVGPSDRNTGSLIELLTRGGHEAIVAQAYVPQSRAGDKRIVMVNGEPVGAVLRVPASNDHRGNMAAGGTPQRTTLTDREKAICQTLGPMLREKGLYLVGIDILGDVLTEVNVTSPTGLVEIDHLDGVSVETQVIALAEQLAVKRGR